MNARTAVFACLLFACGAWSAAADLPNPNIIRSSAEIEGRETQTEVRCRNDSDCESRQYCEHKATLHSVCANCQQRRRRCHNDNMCCPGMRCVNDLCTRPKKTNPDNKNRQPPLDNRRKQKGQERDKCVRSRDCGEGLCCTRYLEEKRCQRIPAEGEGCLIPGRSKGPRAVGRCDCAQGLSCRPLSENYNTHGVCLPSERPA